MARLRWGGPRWHVAAGILGAVIGNGTRDLATAEEPARTAALPAALQAIGPATVLTADEAHRVRGRLKLPGSGVFVQFAGTSQFPGGQLELAGLGGGQSFTLAAGATGVQFATQGTAVSFGAAEKVGVVAAATGVFDGTIAFQGNPRTMTIIAVPGQFAIDLR